MKTKKLNLNDLKVESFVTSLEGKDSRTVYGGSSAGYAIPISILTLIASVVVTKALDNHGVVNNYVL